MSKTSPTYTPPKILYMGVDMSMIVRNDFTQRDDIEATVEKLTETIEMLSRALNTDELLLLLEHEDNYFRIYDNRENSDFLDIQLFNGFWLIDTPWRWFQYFEYIDDEFWLRKMLYKYVVLLGGKDAYPCSVYFSWNSRFWDDEKMTFEKWMNGCKKMLGHDILPIDLEDVKRHTDTFYNKDGVYLDTFEDLTV